MRKSKKYLKTLLEEFDDAITTPEIADNLEQNEPVTGDYIPPSQPTQKPVVEPYGQLQVIKSTINERDLETQFRKGAELLNKIVDETAIIPTYINFSDELISIWFPETGRQEVYDFQEIETFLVERGSIGLSYEEETKTKKKSKPKEEKVDDSTEEDAQQQTNPQQGVQTQQNPNEITPAMLQNNLQNMENTLRRMGKDPQKDQNVMKLRKQVQDYIKSDEVEYKKLSTQTTQMAQKLQQQKQTKPSQTTTTSTSAPVKQTTTSTTIK